MTHPSPFTRKTSVMLLAPLFGILAACGAGDDSSPAQTAAVLVDAGPARPADYAPGAAAIDSGDTASAVTSDEDGPATPDAAAADANRPDRFLALSAAATATTATAAAATTGGRDPLKQPFASNSIWNMPIGSNAQYVPANLPSNPGNNIWAAMPGVDGERIVMKPTAPLTTINTSNAGWSGRNRCAATGGLLLSVPMPSNYVVPHSTGNVSASFLMPDRRSIVQTQPLARCAAGGPGTSMAKFAAVDLYGPGITGAHGGSGLSAIGGSIRLGELRPGTTTGPRHALKVNVYAKEALFKCTTRSACYRWPAVTGDSYAVGFYGSANNNGNTAMKMGALLAIPASRSIASLSLETAPARQLAWTLQNYGAYIVDDTYAPGFAINAEDGPDGSVRTQFKSDYGYDMVQNVNGARNSAWARDMQKLAKALYVVNNNTPASIGGGGTPRQPLAAAIAP